jgi:class 3 adenylate cyclase/tetratricopeptide (TPR) repeat protein
MAGRLDVEDYHELLRLYEHAVAKSIVKFNGHVAQYLGDGVVAYFGWPIAYGNDAERAVRAGLEILACLADLNRNLRDDRHIAARVGIHTGRVVLGQIGIGERREVAALGETPNIAARAQSLAPRGSVVITGATRHLVNEHFDTTAAGEASSLNGAPPTQLYRVTGTIDPLRRKSPRARTSGFVGRETELKFLRECWSEVERGRGQAILLTGEPGIGKSRLTQHFGTTLHSNARTWLEAFCSPFSLNTPFASVVEALARIRERGGSASIEKKSRQLRREAARAGLDVNSAFPILAEMLGLPVTGVAPLLAPPEERHRRFIAIIVEWLARIAAKRPVVVVLEDLQWADPSTLELVESLIQRSCSTSLMLICTSRPEFSPTWSRFQNETRLTIDRLGRSEAIQLVCAVRAGVELPGSTVEMLAERGGGVPLFIEELARALLDQFDGSGTDRLVPATLVDSLTARLDRLGGAKEIAQIASVIGREFSAPMLKEVAQRSREEIALYLRTLVEADLIHPRESSRTGQFSFRHELIRDAAYDSLLRSRRRELHRAVARAMQAQPLESLQTELERLAYHLTKAGDSDAASRAWQKVGERAANRGALLEAVAHYESAIRLLREVASSEKRDQREISLLMTLASMLSATKGLASQEAEGAYRRARELGRRLHPGRANALLGLWQMHVTRGEILAAEELARQRLRIAQETGNSADLCWPHLAVGMTLFHRGALPQAMIHLQNAIDGYVENQLPAATFEAGPLARAYLGVALAFSGNDEGAREAAELALATANQQKRPPTIAFCALNAAAVYWITHDLEKTLRLASEGAASARAHGLDQFAAGLEVYAGWALALTHDASAGVDQIRSAIARWLANGQRLPYAWFLSLLASALAAAGRVGEALETIEQAFGAIGEMRLEESIVRMTKADILSSSCADKPAVERAWKEALGCSRNNHIKLFAERARKAIAMLYDC